MSRVLDDIMVKVPDIMIYMNNNILFCQPRGIAKMFAVVKICYVHPVTKFSL
jgi:hypothetical protein